MIIYVDIDETICLTPCSLDYTKAQPIEKNIEKGIDIIFDIDWQGAQKLSDFSRTDMVSVFILPPSNKALLERLKKRAEDSSAIVKRRMSKAKSEISHWIEYDYVLVNENIKKCKDQIITILNAERNKRSRQKFIFEFTEKLMS